MIKLIAVIVIVFFSTTVVAENAPQTPSPQKPSQEEVKLCIKNIDENILSEAKTSSNELLQRMIDTNFKEKDLREINSILGFAFKMVRNKLVKECENLKPKKMDSLIKKIYNEYIEKIGNIKAYIEQAIKDAKERNRLKNSIFT